MWDVIQYIWGQIEPTTGKPEAVKLPLWMEGTVFSHLDRYNKYTLYLNWNSDISFNMTSQRFNLTSWKPTSCKLNESPVWNSSLVHIIIAIKIFKYHLNIIW